MHKIAVMGDRDSILGFKAIGFDVYPTEGQEEAGELARPQDGYALIYITEDSGYQDLRRNFMIQEQLFSCDYSDSGDKRSSGYRNESVKESVEKGRWQIFYHRKINEYFS